MSEWMGLMLAIAIGLLASRYVYLKALYDEEKKK